MTTSILRDIDISLQRRGESLPFGYLPVDGGLQRTADDRYEVWVTAGRYFRVGRAMVIDPDYPIVTSTAPTVDEAVDQLVALIARAMHGKTPRTLNHRDTVPA